MTHTSWSNRTFTRLFMSHQPNQFLLYHLRSVCFLTSPWHETEFQKRLVSCNQWLSCVKSIFNFFFTKQGSVPLAWPTQGLETSFITRRNKTLTQTCEHASSYKFVGLDEFKLSILFLPFQHKVTTSIIKHDKSTQKGPNKRVPNPAAQLCSIWLPKINTLQSNVPQLLRFFTHWNMSYH